MNQNTLRGISALAVGFIFSVGLAIAGMTQPQKILGFLTFGPNWDPSLLFVMVGAVPVHALAYFAVRGRQSPLLDSSFHMPQSSEITKPLIIGSVIFGLGWGLGGYCPGPAITSMGSGSVGAVVFVFAMLSGMLLYRIFERSKELRKKADTE